MQALSENTLYYALSTIAQCVAALSAFLGAFVLFRLQSSDDRLKELAASLADATTRAGRRSKLELLISGRRYKDALDELAHASRQPGEIGLNYSALQAELAQLDEVRRAFGQLLRPSLGIIAGLVLGIALVDQFKQHQVLAQGLLGTAFVAFVYIMWRMSQVMRYCLDLTLPQHPRRDA